MSQLTNWLPLFNTVYVVLLLALTTAGFFAFRRAYARSITEIQSKVIEAQQQENQTQADQIASLRLQLVHMEATLATIRVALRSRGLTISINGEYVTFTDVPVSKKTTVKIRKELVQEIATRDDTPDEGHQDETPP
jgi:hypothetical protein